MPITVRSLHVYPVKGCAAVDVDSIAFDADGLIVGDRSAMIVDAATGAFVSQRHEPRLATLRASWWGDFLNLKWPGAACDVAFIESDRHRQVTVWDDTFSATDLGDRPARFLIDWLGREVRLVGVPGRSPRLIDSYWAGDDVRSSFADLAPILVASTASLNDLNGRRAAAGLPVVAMARFRPNVVVDGLAPWTEDRIDTLRVASGGLRLIKPCARCNVIELDSNTGDATGDAVLASLATFRASRTRRGKPGVFFGQNAIVCDRRRTFSMTVGDALQSTDSPANAFK